MSFMIGHKIKIWVLGAVMMLQMIGSVFADSGIEKWNKANVHYEKGEYEKALTLYEQLLNEGYEDAELAYNMGCAAYKSNQVALSILGFEKALKLNPSNEDARFNLQLARALTQDKIEEPYKGALDTVIESVALQMKANTWAVLVIVISFLLAGSAYFFMFSNKIAVRRASFILIWVMAGAGLITYAFSRYAYNRNFNKTEAVIVSDSVTIKGEPHEDSKELFVLHSGTKVKVISSLSSWIQITLPNGNGGWVRADNVREI